MEKMNLFKKALMMMAMLLSFSAVNAVNCDCDPFEEPTLCVDLGGLVIPMTECDYNCLVELGDENDFEIVDCEDVIIIDDEGTLDCDCEGQEDEIICVADAAGNVIPVPECLYACLGDFGFPDMEIVDCGDIIIDGGGSSGNNDTACDCEGQEEEIICVEDENGIVLPIPECLYECLLEEGTIPEMTIVDCEDIIIDDEGPDCDCEGEEEEIICVEDEFGFIMPIPECLYNCLIEEGDFPEMTIVDCEDIIIDDEGPDCDCDGEEEEIICLEDASGFVLTIPECLYNCLLEEGEFEEMTIVDCDFDEDGDDEDDEFDCDCEGEEDEILCVEDEFGNVIPFPACLYECLVSAGEFPEMNVVDCGDIIIDGGGDDAPDCDCEGEEDEIICVEDEYGFVMPIPECLYNCLLAEEGFPELTIVDCDEIIIDDEGDNGTDCDCEGNEEETICVVDEFGFVAEIPLCLYECFIANDLPELEVVDCDSDGEEEGSGLIDEATGWMAVLDVLDIFPNPIGNDGTVNLTVESSNETRVNVRIQDLTGKIVKNEIITQAKGITTHRIGVENLESGIYLLTLNNESGMLKSEKLIIQ